MSWPPLTARQQEQFQGFVIEYQRQLANGSFGAWQRADSSRLSASSTTYGLSFPQSGYYQVRAGAVLTGGQYVSLFGQRPAIISNGESGGELHSAACYFVCVEIMTCDKQLVSTQLPGNAALK